MKKQKVRKSKTKAPIEKPKTRIEKLRARRKRSKAQNYRAIIALSAVLLMLVIFAVTNNDGAKGKDNDKGQDLAQNGGIEYQKDNDYKYRDIDVLETPIYDPPIIKEQPQDQLEPEPNEPQNTNQDQASNSGGNQTPNPVAAPQNQSITDIINSSRKLSNSTLMVSIHDFKTGEKVSHNASQRIHPASVKKTLYMLMFLEEVKFGRRSLEQLYTLKEEDKYGNPGPKVTGTGILQGAAAGTQYTWGKLMSLMISISDNVATNLFIDNLGMSNINERAKVYGLKDTAIVRKLYQDISGNNHSTGDDMNEVLVALHSKKFVDGDLYDYAIKIMKETTNKSRIGRYAPKDVVVANKTGTITEVVGDSAIIFYPDRPPIALTIFIAGNNDSYVPGGEADEIIGQLSKNIIEHYKER